jgi:hypothetical protein
MDISKINQRKSWITKAKGRGRLFDIVVQFIQKLQVHVVLDDVEHVAQDECPNEEQVQDEPEGVHEATAGKDEVVDQERVVVEGLVDERERDVNRPLNI